MKTTVDIWKMLKEDQDFEPFLDRVPDKFFKWATRIRDLLIDEYELIEYTAHTEYEYIKELQNDKNSKKEFAHLASKTKYPSIIFAINSGKDYQKKIWNQIKPKKQNYEI